MDHLSGLLQAALRDMDSRMSELSDPEAEGHPVCFIALASGTVLAVDAAAALGAAQELCTALAGWSYWQPVPGDVVVTNDPYLGSAHLQDFTVLVPFWAGADRPAGYVGVTRHIPDIGGDVPGGYNPMAEEIWAEGVRVTPVRIYRAGRRDRGAFGTLMLNSRRPDAMEQSLVAMAESALSGVARLAGQPSHAAIPAQLPPGFSPAASALCERTRSEISSATAAWRRGEATATSAVSLDALGDSAPRDSDIAVQAKVTCSESGFSVDLTTSAAQVRLPLNCSRGNTVAHAVLPLLAALSGKPPYPPGFLDSVEVRTVPATLVHARLPAPTGYGTFTVGTAIARATASALEHLLPDRLADQMTERLEGFMYWHPSPVAGLLKGGH